MTSLNIAITGAGTGIGRGAALGLARGGHKVLATVQFDKQASEINELGEPNLRAEKVDLLSSADRERLAAQHIDVLINNAAVSETGPIAEQPLELVRRVFETNVFSTLALTQSVARRMVERGRGRIIFVSSMAGLMPIPYVGAYCASKHALEAIAGTMQAELAPHGVEVLTFQPGPYKTGFNDQMWATQKKWFDPSKNFTRPEDMAGTAAILDQQLDPDEAINALVALAPSPNPHFRNVVPLAIENMIKGIQTETWSRRI
jgi:NAD(P)-dependent dehydrogenase (short-subunit alcohol dehydrogenase family)